MPKYRHLSCFLLLFVSLCSSAAAPGVVLKDFAGKNRNANEFIGRGKWTVVTVWAHNCMVCKQEIHEMVLFHHAHRKSDAIVLGVSVDGYANRSKAEQFIEDQGLNFTNLVAEPEAIERLVGAPLENTPTIYIYRPNGKLAGKSRGPLTREQVETFIKSGGKVMK